MMAPDLSTTLLAGSTTLLAGIPSPPQGVWDLGPLPFVGSIPIRAYALWIILGIVVAVWWGERRWAARGGQPGTVVDAAIWAVPFGLVGARLYHVATDYWRYFGEGNNPLDILRIWDGGLGIWGGVAGGFLGAYIGLRRMGVRAPGALADSVAPGIVLAQGIGRLGNYFNQELYGRETDLPWGLEIYERFDPVVGSNTTHGVSTGEVLAVVHPTFLYELIWNVVVALLLVLIDRRFRIGHGRLFAMYVALYCFGRFWVEGIRVDTATEVFGLRINSIVAIVVMLVALAYVIFAKKGREEPGALQPVGKGDSGSGAVIDPGADGESADDSGGAGGASDDGSDGVSNGVSGGEGTDDSPGGESGDTSR